MLIFGFIVIVGTVFIFIFCIAALCQVISDDKPKAISTEQRVGLSKLSYPAQKVVPYSPAPFRIIDADIPIRRTKGKVRVYKRTTTEMIIEIDE